MREISFAAAGRNAVRIGFHAAVAALTLALPAVSGAQQTPVVLDAMTTELHRAFT